MEKREKDLEVYLQTLLAAFPGVAPRVLAHFLHFHFYVSSPQGSPVPEPWTTELWASALRGGGWRETVRLEDGGASP